MLKTEYIKDITLENSNIVKDGKVIFSITKNYDDLSDEDKIKVLDFTMEILNASKVEIEKHLEIKEFLNKFNFDEEVLNSREEVFTYLEGYDRKFKKLEYLEGFLRAYYWVKRGNYSIPNSVLKMIIDRIKSGCCEDE